MGVVASSYLATVASNAITMLSLSPTFQALLGVSTPAAAKGRIVENWGGTIIQAGAGRAKATDGTAFDLVAPFAIVAANEMPSDFGGIGVYDRSGLVQLEIVVPGLQAGEAPADLSRRAANVVDDIRADLETVAGQPNCLATFTVDAAIQPLPDETGPSRNDVVGFLAINWRA